MKTGIELIAEERTRQVSQEGWTPEHDAQHIWGELSAAAACYADTATFQTRYQAGAGDVENVKENNAEFWPWDLESFKVSADPVRNLVKAGALIAAEIDRINRATAMKEDGE